jgi:hypothetical protein
MTPAHPRKLTSVPYLHVVPDLDAGEGALQEAQGACQRAAARRTVAIHLLAISGIALWVVAKWPSLIGRPGRPMVLFFWMATLLFTIGAALWEWQCHRERARCEKALAAPTPRRAA